MGRKVITPPTPEISPSTSRPVSQAGAPKELSHADAPGQSTFSRKAAMPSESQAPGAAEGDEEHHQHHGQEQGQGEVLVGGHRVDALGDGGLAADAAALHAGADHPLHKAVAAVRQQRLPVPQLAGGLVLRGDLVDAPQGGLPQSQVLGHLAVPLQQLDGRPVGGDAPLVSPVVDDVPDAVVDSVGEIVVEVVGSSVSPVCIWRWASSTSLSMFCPSRAEMGITGTPRWAASLPQSIWSPFFSHLVHEVQRQNHGPLQLQQLHGQ